MKGADGVNWVGMKRRKPSYAWLTANDASPESQSDKVELRRPRVRKSTIRGSGSLSANGTAENGIRSGALCGCGQGPVRRCLAPSATLYATATEHSVFSQAAAGS